MTGTGWPDLVTTALLGTDRRPLPPGLVADAGGRAGSEPAEVLLAAAARHRAVARAAAPLHRCPAPGPVPPPDLPDAPAAAQQLLGQLLAKPVPELVHAWLAAAERHGVRAAPEHWSDLAALAASRPHDDRRVLGRALGRQGSWFLRQNPSWQRLAEAVQRGLNAGPASGAAPAAGAGAVVDPHVPGPGELRSRPEAAFEVPAPWPRPLTVGALQVLLSGQLGWQAARYAAGVGARMARDDADLLSQAAGVLAETAPGVGPGARLAREALAAVEQAARARAEIDGTFDLPDPAGAGATRSPDAQEDSR